MNVGLKINFKELQIREIGTWPLQLRIGFLVFIVIFSLILFNNLIVSSSLDSISLEQMKINKMQQEYIVKHNIVANLHEYQMQTKQIQSIYEKVMHEIPDSSNIADLINQISNEASAEGLKYELIKPGNGTSNDNILMELPISLKLVGTYHGFGRFLSRLAELQRILTIHNFSITSLTDPNIIKSNNEYGSLVFELEIKAYWLAGDAPNA